MPRKKLTITHEFPYHIYARSNNKEWFYLPMDECWDIFSGLLQQAVVKFKFNVHAFLLMNNHYHMIATTHEDYPLPKVMEWYQRSVNRMINNKAGRINHLFGGPYRATLLSTELDYYHAYKYLYRNPMQANICRKSEDYKYSTLKNKTFPLVYPITGIDNLLPRELKLIINEINKPYSEEAESALEKAINKVDFKFSSRMEKKLKVELIDTPGRKKDRRT